MIGLPTLIVAYYSLACALLDKHDLDSHGPLYVLLASASNSSRRSFTFAAPTIYNWLPKFPTHAVYL